MCQAGAGAASPCGWSSCGSRASMPPKTGTRGLWTKARYGLSQVGLDSEWLVGWCCSAPKDAEGEQDCWHAGLALHKGTEEAAFPA